MKGTITIANKHGSGKRDGSTKDHRHHINLSGWLQGIELRWHVSTCMRNEWNDIASVHEKPTSKRTLKLNNAVQSTAPAAKDWNTIGKMKYACQENAIAMPMSSRQCSATFKQKVRTLGLNHNREPSDKLTLGNTEPIQTATYRASPRVKDFKPLEIDWMRSQEITKPDQMECLAPVMFASKKYKSLHFCIDYQKLNAVPDRNSYLLLRMDRCIYTLEESAMFSTLSTDRSYWLVRADKADRDETFFTSHHRLNRFASTLFDLKNAPESFQHSTDVIMSQESDNTH